LDRHGLLVPAGTRPGTYEMQVVLYEAESLEGMGSWFGPTVTVEAGR
jgi:hypothetical protein